MLMTKTEVKLIRLVSKSDLSDEEAAKLLEEIMEFTEEIKAEFRQIYDPIERP